MTEAIRVIDKDKILEEVEEFATYYHKLVWAARNPPIDASTEVWEEYWSNKDQPSYVKVKPTPIDIRAKAVEELRKIVDEYPEEYSKIKDEEVGDYHQGFNGGSLAAFRWIIQSFDEELYTETANQWYPDLDT